MEKIDLVKMNTQMFIDTRKAEIEELQRDIKDCASRYSAFDIVTFLPNKIRELEKNMEELKMYEEQMKALEFISKEN